MIFSGNFCLFRAFSAAFSRFQPIFADLLNFRAIFADFEYFSDFFARFLGLFSGSLGSALVGEIQQSEAAWARISGNSGRFCSLLRYFREISADLR